jgi:hypothetical protein
VLSNPRVGLLLRVRGVVLLRRSWWLEGSSTCPPPSRQRARARRIEDSYAHAISGTGATKSCESWLASEHRDSTYRYPTRVGARRRGRSSAVQCFNGADRLAVEG